MALQWRETSFVASHSAARVQVPIDFAVEEPEEELGFILEIEEPIKPSKVEISESSSSSNESENGAQIAAIEAGQDAVTEVTPEEPPMSLEALQGELQIMHRETRALQNMLVSNENAGDEAPQGVVEAWQQRNMFQSVSRSADAGVVSVGVSSTSQVVVRRQQTEEVITHRRSASRRLRRPRPGNRGYISSSSESSPELPRFREVRDAPFRVPKDNTETGTSKKAAAVESNTDTSTTARNQMNEDAAITESAARNVKDSPREIPAAENPIPKEASRERIVTGGTVNEDSRTENSFEENATAGEITREDTATDEPTTGVTATEEPRRENLFSAESVSGQVSTEEPIGENRNTEEQNTDVALEEPLQQPAATEEQLLQQLMDEDPSTKYSPAGHEASQYLVPEEQDATDANNGRRSRSSYHNMIEGLGYSSEDNLSDEWKEEDFVEETNFRDTSDSPDISENTEITLVTMAETNDGLATKVEEQLPSETPVRDVKAAKPTSRKRSSVGAETVVKPYLETNLDNPVLYNLEKMSEAKSPSPSVPSEEANKDAPVLNHLKSEAEKRTEDIPETEQTPDPAEEQNVKLTLEHITKEADEVKSEYLEEPKPEVQPENDKQDVIAEPPSNLENQSDPRASQEADKEIPTAASPTTSEGQGKEDNLKSEERGRPGSKKRPSQKPPPPPRTSSLLPSDPESRLQDALSNAPSSTPDFSPPRESLGSSSSSAESEAAESEDAVKMRETSSKEDPHVDGIKRVSIVYEELEKIDIPQVPPPPSQDSTSKSPALSTPVPTPISTPPEESTSHNGVHREQSITYPATSVKPAQDITTGLSVVSPSLSPNDSPVLAADTESSNNSQKSPDEDSQTMSSKQYTSEESLPSSLEYIPEDTRKSLSPSHSQASAPSDTSETSSTQSLDPDSFLKGSLETPSSILSVSPGLVSLDLEKIKIPEIPPPPPRHPPPAVAIEASSSPCKEIRPSQVSEDSPAEPLTMPLERVLSDLEKLEIPGVPPPPPRHPPPPPPHQSTTSQPLEASLQVIPEESITSDTCSSPANEAFVQLSEVSTDDSATSDSSLCDSDDSAAPKDEGAQTPIQTPLQESYKSPEKILERLNSLEIPEVPPPPPARPPPPIAIQSSPEQLCGSSSLIEDDFPTEFKMSMKTGSRSPSISSESSQGYGVETPSLIRLQQLEEIEIPEVPPPPPRQPPPAPSDSTQNIISEMPETQTQNTSAGAVDTLSTSSSEVCEMHTLEKTNQQYLEDFNASRLEQRDPITYLTSSPITSHSPRQQILEELRNIEIPEIPPPPPIQPPPPSDPAEAVSANAFQSTTPDSSQGYTVPSYDVSSSTEPGDKESSETSSTSTDVLESPPMSMNLEDSLPQTDEPCLTLRNQISSPRVEVSPPKLLEELEKIEIPEVPPPPPRRPPPHPPRQPPPPPPHSFPSQQPLSSRPSKPSKASESFPFAADLALRDTPVSSSTSTTPASTSERLTTRASDCSPRQDLETPVEEVLSEVHSSTPSSPPPLQPQEVTAQHHDEAPSIQPPNVSLTQFPEFADTGSLKEESQFLPSEVSFQQVPEAYLARVIENSQAELTPGVEEIPHAENHRPLLPYVTDLDKHFSPSEEETSSSSSSSEDSSSSEEEASSSSSSEHEHLYTSEREGILLPVPVPIPEVSPVPEIKISLSPEQESSTTPDDQQTPLIRGGVVSSPGGVATSSVPEKTVSSVSEKGPVSSGPDKKLPSSVPEKEAVSSMPEKDAISSVPEKKVIYSVAEKEVISSVPEKKVISSVAEKKVVSSVPQKEAVSSMPQKEVVSSVPEKKVVSSVPQKEAVSSVPQKEVVSSVPKKKVVSSVPQKEIIPSVPQKEVVSSVQDIKVVVPLPLKEVVSSSSQEDSCTSSEEEVSTTHKDLPSVPQHGASSPPQQASSQGVSSSTEDEVCLSPQLGSSSSKEEESISPSEHDLSSALEHKASLPSPLEVVPVPQIEISLAPEPEPSITPDEEQVSRTPGEVISSPEDVAASSVPEEVVSSVPKKVSSVPGELISSEPKITVSSDPKALVSSEPEMMTVPSKLEEGVSTSSQEEQDSLSSGRDSPLSDNNRAPTKQDVSNVPEITISFAPEMECPYASETDEGVFSAPEKVPSLVEEGVSFASDASPKSDVAQKSASAAPQITSAPKRESFDAYQCDDSQTFTSSTPRKFLPENGKESLATSDGRSLKTEVTETPSIITQETITSPAPSQDLQDKEKSPTQAHSASRHQRVVHSAADQPQDAQKGFSTQAAASSLPKPPPTVTQEQPSSAQPKCLTSPIKPSVQPSSTQTPTKPSIPIKPSGQPSSPQTPTKPSLIPKKPSVKSPSSQTPTKPPIPTKPSVQLPTPQAPTKPSSIPIKPSVKPSSTQTPTKPPIPAKPSVLPSLPQTPPRPSLIPKKPSAQPSLSQPPTKPSSTQVAPTTPSMTQTPTQTLPTKASAPPPPQVSSVQASSKPSPLQPPTQPSPKRIAFPATPAKPAPLQLPDQSPIVLPQGTPSTESSKGDEARDKPLMGPVTYVIFPEAVMKEEGKEEKEEEKGERKRGISQSSEDTEEEYFTPPSGSPPLSPGPVRNEAPFRDLSLTQTQWISHQEGAGKTFEFVTWGNELEVIVDSSQSPRNEGRDAGASQLSPDAGKRHSQPDVSELPSTKRRRLSCEAEEDDLRNVLTVCRVRSRSPSPSGPRLSRLTSAIEEALSAEAPEKSYEIQITVSVLKPSQAASPEPRVRISTQMRPDSPAPPAHRPSRPPASPPAKSVRSKEKTKERDTAASPPLSSLSESESAKRAMMEFYVNNLSSDTDSDTSTSSTSTSTSSSDDDGEDDGRSYQVTAPGEMGLATIEEDAEEDSGAESSGHWMFSADNTDTESVIHVPAALTPAPLDPPLRRPPEDGDSTASDETLVVEEEDEEEKDVCSGGEGRGGRQEAGVTVSNSHARTPASTPATGGHYDSSASEDEHSSQGTERPADGSSLKAVHRRRRKPGDGRPAGGGARLPHANMLGPAHATRIFEKHVDDVFDFESLESCESVSGGSEASSPGHPGSLSGLEEADVVFNMSATSQPFADASPTLAGTIKGTFTSGVAAGVPHGPEEDVITAKLYEKGGAPSLIPTPGVAPAGVGEEENEGDLSNVISNAATDLVLSSSHSDGAQPDEGHSGPQSIDMFGLPLRWTPGHDTRQTATDTTVTAGNRNTNNTEAEETNVTQMRSECDELTFANKETHLSTSFSSLAAQPSDRHSSEASGDAALTPPPEGVEASVTAATQEAGSAACEAQQEETVSASAFTAGENSSEARHRHTPHGPAHHHHFSVAPLPQQSESEALLLPPSGASDQDDIQDAMRDAPKPPLLRENAATKAPVGGFTYGEATSVASDSKVTDYFASGEEKRVSSGLRPQPVRSVTCGVEFPSVDSDTDTDNTDGDYDEEDHFAAELSLRISSVPAATTTKVKSFRSSDILNLIGLEGGRAGPSGAGGASGDVSPPASQTGSSPEVPDSLRSSEGRSATRSVETLSEDSGLGDRDVRLTPSSPLASISEAAPRPDPAAPAQVPVTSRPRRQDIRQARIARARSCGDLRGYTDSDSEEEGGAMYGFPPHPASQPLTEGVNGAPYGSRTQPRPYKPSSVNYLQQQQQHEGYRAARLPHRSQTLSGSEGSDEELRSRFTNHRVVPSGHSKPRRHRSFHEASRQVPAGWAATHGASRPGRRRPQPISVDLAEQFLSQEGLKSPQRKQTVEDPYGALGEGRGEERRMQHPPSLPGTGGVACQAARSTPANQQPPSEVSTNGGSVGSVGSGSELCPPASSLTPELTVRRAWPAAQAAPPPLATPSRPAPAPPTTRPPAPAPLPHQYSSTPAQLPNECQPVHTGGSSGSPTHDPPSATDSELRAASDLNEQCLSGKAGDSPAASEGINTEMEGGPVRVHTKTYGQHGEVEVYLARSDSGRRPPNTSPILTPRGGAEHRPGPRGVTFSPSVKEINWRESYYEAEPEGEEGSGSSVRKVLVVTSESPTPQRVDLTPSPPPPAHVPAQSDSHNINNTPEHNAPAAADSAAADTKTNGRVSEGPAGSSSDAEMSEDKSPRVQTPLWQRFRLPKISSPKSPRPKIPPKPQSLSSRSSDTESSKLSSPGVDSSSSTPSSPDTKAKKAPASPRFFSWGSKREKKVRVPPPRPVVSPPPPPAQLNAGQGEEGSGAGVKGEPDPAAAVSPAALPREDRVGALENSDAVRQEQQRVSPPKREERVIKSPVGPVAAERPRLIDSDGFSHESGRSPLTSATSGEDSSDAAPHPSPRSALSKPPLPPHLQRPTQQVFHKARLLSARRQYFSQERQVSAPERSSPPKEVPAPPVPKPREALQQRIATSRYNSAFDASTNLKERFERFSASARAERERLARSTPDLSVIEASVRRQGPRIDLWNQCEQQQQQAESHPASPASASDGDAARPDLAHRGASSSHQKARAAIHERYKNRAQRIHARARSQSSGVLETDLDTGASREVLTLRETNLDDLYRDLQHLLDTIPPVGAAPTQADKTRAKSLLDLEASAAMEAQLAAPARPPDTRAKSMEFLLDDGNKASIQPPENELMKGSERQLSEAELRVRRSLQRLDVPEWMKNAPPPQQGFLLRRRDYGSSSATGGGWSAYSSKTASMTSLGSSRAVTPNTPTKVVIPTRVATRGAGGVGGITSPASNCSISPSPSDRSGSLFQYPISRWSTSRLNSGTTTPTGSVTSSRTTNTYTRQPYLGWRSQTSLASLAGSQSSLTSTGSYLTAADRLALGITSYSQRFVKTTPSTQDKENSSSEANAAAPKPENAEQNDTGSTNGSVKLQVPADVADVHSSIKEVTSAIVHYCNESTPSPRASPRGSPRPDGRAPSPRRLVWVESSFVGSRPITSPETPTSSTHAITPTSQLNGHDLPESGEVTSRPPQPPGEYLLAW